MNSITSSTHACTIEELNAGLRAAMRAHGTHYDLSDIESDVLMCCETKSARIKKGLFGGMEDTLSAVYVTPKWLVWAISANGHLPIAGSAQLRDINMRDYEETSMGSIMPDQGLNITGRYTNVNQTGITFLSLGTEADGKNFRLILEDAIKKATK